MTDELILDPFSTDARVRAGAYAQAERDRLRELLREAHDVLDADGHQVLSCRIHRALEGDR